ncbi:MAG TPA: TetR family transcriptional regulator [Solirubrobacteraceae bacterium]|jgi:AcrR family transcriptional regulator|nr:TetR family transcriptional regulator [Solirubrobacteraceae bacterium]
MTATTLTETAQRILAAATRQFAAKGLAGARVDEIAREAGVNKQLIYHYFGGKLELYNEVLGRLVESSQPKREAEAACDTLAEKMELLTRLGMHPNSALWQRLLGWEALETDPAGGIVREEDRRATWERHVESVRAAQAAGEVDPSLDPELVAVAVVSMAVLPFMLPQVVKFMTGRLPTDEAFLEPYESLVGELVARLGQPRT